MKQIAFMGDELRDFLARDLANRNSAEIWYLDRGDGSKWFSSADGITKAMSRFQKVLGIYEEAKPVHGCRATLATGLCK